MQSFDIWYVASPSGPLPSLFIWCPRGQNWDCPGVHKLKHRNKERKFQNSSSLKLERLELWYLVYSISLRTSTKFVHMMPLGSKLAPSWGSQVGTQEQRSPSSKFFFSETVWHKDLIFGMWRLFVDLYQVCRKMPLGSKLAPPRGSQVWNIGTKNENFIILLLWNWKA